MSDNQLPTTEADVSLDPQIVKLQALIAMLTELDLRPIQPETYGTPAPEVDNPNPAADLFSYISGMVEKPNRCFFANPTAVPSTNQTEPYFSMMVTTNQQAVTTPDDWGPVLKQQLKPVKSLTEAIFNPGPYAFNSSIFYTDGAICKPQGWLSQDGRIIQWVEMANILIVRDTLDQYIPVTSQLQDHTAPALFFETRNVITRQEDLLRVYLSLAYHSRYIQMLQTITSMIV